MELIQKIQSQLETVYGIKINEQAEDYLIEQDALKNLLPQNQSASAHKELFLVNPNPRDETLEVALFFDAELRHNLEVNNPLERLSRDNISDFCSLIEGVSHFVYYIHKAQMACEVTQLEMELQAEIDKFVLLCLLTDSLSQDSATHLLELLFENYNLHEHLTHDQIQRYHTASRLACQYCFRLAKNMSPEKMNDLKAELREFYSLPQQQKIRQIVN